MNADDVAYFTFTIASSSVVQIQSWQFGGGVTSGGTLVAATALDTLIAIYDGVGPTAVLNAYNDDGSCPPANLNPYCGDSRLELLLPPGDYTLAIASTLNLPIGPTLGAGWSGGGLSGGDFTVELTEVPEPHTALCCLALLPLLARLRRHWLPAGIMTASLCAGADLVVPPGGNLQAALNAAQPGDNILLSPGAVYAGSFVAPAKSGTGWITITTQGFSVPAGNRVSPAHSIQMAVLSAPAAVPALTFDSQSRRYRLVGVEVRPATGTYTFQLIAIGTGFETTLAALPAEIEIDRCYIHGDAGTGGKRGISANGTNVRVTNSYVSGFGSSFQDAQAIFTYNSPGPMQFVNNYLEASGQSIFLGGAPPLIPGVVPSDIQILRNHLRKPLSWRVGTPGYDGTNYVIKYLLELKMGRRVVIDGNVLENNWRNYDAGRAVVMGPVTENGEAPQAVLEDIRFTRNIIRNVGSGLLIFGRDPGNLLGAGRRILVRDNVFTGVSINNAIPGFYSSGVFVDLSYGPSDVTISHNTALVDGGPLTLREPSLPIANLRYVDNIVPYGAYGVQMPVLGVGVGALNTIAPGNVFLSNVIPEGSAALLPAANFLPSSLASVGFANLALEDLRLRPDSPYYRAGTDGKDIGADVAGVLQATQGVVAGTGGRCATSLSPALVTLPAAGGSANVSLAAPAGCLWYTTIPTDWLRIVSGYSGLGPATITVSAPALPAGLLTRSSTLQAGGWKVVVRQQ